MTTASRSNIGTELADLNEKIATERTGLSRLYMAYSEARDKFATSGKGTDSREFHAAEDARAAYEEASEPFQALEDRRDALIGMLDGNRPRDPVADAGKGRSGTGPLAGGNSGWRKAAGNLRLVEGRNRFETHLDQLLQPQAAIGVTPSSGASAPAIMGEPVTPGQDRRLLHPLLASQRVDEGVLAIDDWRIISRRTGTATAASDLVNVTGHGFAAGDKVVFTTLTGGAGLTEGQAYYVVSASLATDAFKVSTTPGTAGTPTDITTNYSAIEVLNVSQLGRVVAGAIERDPLSTAEKATLALNVELANESLNQLAIMVPGIPNALLSAIDRFGDYLANEAAYQLALEADTHAVSQILASNPLTGSGGTAMWQKLRYAVGQLREIGANPTVAAMNPTDAAALDLTVVGSDDMPVFSLRSTGSASGIWGLTVAEVPAVAAGSPIVLDPVRLGVYYQGDASLLLDPYTNASTNQSRLRVEAHALYHVRDSAAALVVG